MSASRARRALISVSDKTGVVAFARALAARGVEILSTGGTARTLSEAGVSVREVSDYTGFPEIMDGRVKTLHPKVHGGILGRAGVDDAVMAEHGIEPIDLVVVNLYPFRETVARPDCTPEQAIEQIDIGGPALLRAAAKHHARVTVLVDPADYDRVLSSLEADDPALRRALAAKAYAHTAAYDGAVADYLSRLESEPPARWPRFYTRQFERVEPLRYGENPHQAAAFYRDHTPQPGTLAAARLLQGKALSYNNLADADAAWECVKQFDPPACVIVKHANPCGVALGDDLTVAYDRAYATDPESAFGGIIAFNRALDPHTARTLIERQFVEVIIAPEITEDALAALASKKNVRVLACGAPGAPAGGEELKTVGGGVLVQERDTGRITRGDLKVVTRRAPSEQELDDLLFAWRVCKFVKSNAIVYARDRQTIGVGAGQMSRVYSARIAAIKAADAGLEVAGSVLASDAFFPFRDGLDAAARVGVTAVIQPGGSRRDAEVIAAADEHGIAMVFTGMRHFRH